MRLSATAAVNTTSAVAKLSARAGAIAAKTGGDITKAGITVGKTMIQGFARGLI